MSEGLPLKALPELSTLLDKLHKALTDEMQEYTKAKNASHFKQVINSLGHDLSEFTKSIDAWHNLSTTPEQHDKIRDIEFKIDEARGLLTKAIGLIKS